MTSFDVDKLVGHTPQKSNPLMTVFLVLYFPVAGFLLLMSTILGFERLSAIGTLVTLGLGLGLPGYLRKKLKQNWKKRYLTALSMLGTCVLLFILGFSSIVSEASNGSTSSTSTTISSTPYFDTTPTSSSEPQPSSNHYEIGEQFQVGYTQYRVLNKKWQRQLGNEYFGSTADGRYLLVRIQVKNLDREERLVPQFKLVDEDGAEYKESSDSFYLGKEAQVLKSLNPSVQTKLTALFDVPPEHHYTLKLSGGYWSSDEAFVNLN